MKSFLLFTLSMTLLLPIEGYTTTIDSLITPIIQNAIKSAPYPGLQIAIYKKGKIIFSKGYGKADSEHNIPVTPQTIFQVGSLTKSLTAVSILQLAEQGKISLDDDVNKYLPKELVLQREIPIGTLLNHTSGIPDYMGFPNAPSTEASTPDYSVTQMVSLFQNLPSAFPLGEQYLYSDSGYFLLGLVIEKVSGLSYESYLQQAIFNPAGMTRSSYNNGNRNNDNNNLAVGYAPTSNGLKPGSYFSPTAAFSAGAVLSTAEDIGLYQVALHTHKLLSKKTYQKFVLKKTKLVDGTWLEYTYGGLLKTQFDSDQGPFDKLSHSGQIVGFSSQQAYYPKNDQLGIIILSNAWNVDPDPVNIERAIARELLGIPRPVIRSLKLSVTELNKYVGHYQLYPKVFGPKNYEFTQSNGQLFLSLGGSRPLPLLAQGHDRFVASFDSEFTIQFDGSHSFLLHWYDGSLKGQKQ